jgi:hypothetical protein
MKNFAILLATLAGLVLAIPAAEAARKTNVGHYTALLRYKSDHATMLEVASQPGMRGIMKRYKWRDLEPTKGNYTLTEMKSDLDFAHSYGMQFLILIEDKTFSDRDIVMPDYLLPYAPYNHEKGRTAVRWNLTVENRYKMLITAIANKMGAHPALEAIVLQETALGLDSTTLDKWGYTAQNYADSYVRVIKHINAAMPTVNTMWYANYIPRDQSRIGNVLDRTRYNNVILGNPDVWPANETLVRMSYPFYDKYQWQVPLMAQIEQPCYFQLHSGSGWSTKYWTMRELFDYGKNKMHLDYFVWVQVRKEFRVGAYDWFDALPVIANNPPPFNPLL